MREPTVADAEFVTSSVLDVTSTLVVVVVVVSDEAVRGTFDARRRFLVYFPMPPTQTPTCRIPRWRTHHCGRQWRLRV